MILRFKCKETERLINGEISRKFPSEIQRIARKKLILLRAAHDVIDLKLPPGNQLKKLKGKRAGQYSIRINDQWRICFKWNKPDSYNVEITDYH